MGWAGVNVFYSRETSWCREPDKRAEGRGLTGRGQHLLGGCCSLWEKRQNGRRFYEASSSSSSSSGVMHPHSSPCWSSTSGAESSIIRAAVVIAGLTFEPSLRPTSLDLRPRGRHTSTYLELGLARPYGKPLC